MAGIAVVPGRDCVCTGLVLRVIQRIQADLILHLSPSSWVPHLCAGMIETHRSDRQVWDYIVGMNDPEELFFRVHPHNKISECLIAGPRGTEVVHMHCSLRVQVFLNVNSCESGKRSTQGVASYKHPGCRVVAEKLRDC